MKFTGKIYHFAGYLIIIIVLSSWVCQSCIGA